LTEEIKTKVCSHCHIEKPTTEFYKDRRSKNIGSGGGVANECKKCKREYDSKRANDIKTSPKNYNSPKKLCSRCNIEKPTSEFCKNIREKDGYQYICKSCTKIEREKYKIEKNNRCVDCGELITRRSKRCPKCSGRKISLSPNWIENHKKLIESNLKNIKWLEKLRIFSIERKQDPNFVERYLIGANGEGFWYGNAALKNFNNGKKIPLYCEKFKDVDQRVRIFQENKCLLCGKTESENGNKLDNHHVFYEKKTCCWIDENGEYWTNLNAKDHKQKDYYIGTNPNYFALLCASCHSSTGGHYENRKKSADKLREIIDMKFDGISYYSEKEMVEKGYVKRMKHKWEKIE
jgi:hypothetical protein